MFRGNNLLNLYKTMAHNHADSFPGFEMAFYNFKGYNQAKSLDTAVTSIMADLLLYQREIQKELKKVIDNYPEIAPLIEELEFCVKYSEKFNYLHKYLKNDMEMHEVFDDMKGGKKPW